MIQDVVAVQGSMFAQPLGCELDPSGMQFPGLIETFLGNLQDRCGHIRGSGKMQRPVAEVQEDAEPWAADPADDSVLQKEMIMGGQFKTRAV